MSTRNTTPSRRIVVNSSVAKAPGSEMAISLVDEAGKLLHRASVNEDGSCQLSEKALASADEVVVELGSVLVDADPFRELIKTEKPVDITALLACGVNRANMDGPTSGNHNGWPPRGGTPGPSGPLFR